MAFTFGICIRCGVGGRVFPIEGRTYCEPCAALCINHRPDYRKSDRRHARNPPRGFGRRFPDPVR